MKRLLAIALIATLAFTMTACSSKSKEEENIDNTPSIEESVEEETEEEVEEEVQPETSETPEITAPVTKPAETVQTPAATQKPATTQKPSTTVPTTPAPVTPPVTTPKPTEYKSGQLKGTYDATIAKVYAGNGPNFEVTGDASFISGRFGIESSLYNEALVAMPMMNVNVDIFMGFEAKDSKSAESIKAKLDSYKASVIADREAFPYLPDHLPKARAAKVVTKGNYVFYISMADIPMETEENKMQEVIDAGVKSAVDACLGAIK